MNNNLGTSDPSRAQKAAGDHLVAVVGEYVKLENDLSVETSGSTAATVIARQQAIDESRGKRPLIYLTTVRVATTAVTKKGFFTGMFGSGAPRLSGLALADYVIIFGEIQSRGTVSCYVTALTPTELAAMGPAVPASSANLYKAAS